MGYYLVLYEATTNHLGKPQMRRTWKEILVGTEEEAVKVAGKDTSEAKKIVFIIPKDKLSVTAGTIVEFTS